MSAIIGTVTSIAGGFSISRANGNTGELLKGDVIHEGDIVNGSKDSTQLNSLVVGMTDGVEIVMLGDDSQLFDLSLLQEEFSENETVTEIGSVDAMVANGDFIEEFEDDIDELDTASGEEEILSSSTDTPMVNFAEIDNNGVDINAELRDVENSEKNDILDNNYEVNREANAFNTDGANSEISDMLSNMSELINSANLAVIAANDAARLANSAATVADLDPTVENLAAAERAQITANVASIDVSNAATLLEELIVDLNAAAVATGQTVDTTDASRAVDDANAASLAASDAAIYSETTTDSEIEDMLQGVSDLTDVLNIAAQNTNLAADAVTSAINEAQNNPTPENLEAVENAQEAVNFAVENAQNAATELDNAIDSLNEAVNATNETVDTTDALEAIKNSDDASLAAVTAAITAEVNSDAEIAQMVSNLSDLTDAANTAAESASEAATAASNAANTAQNNPTPENLEAAEDAQATATEAATAASNAASTLEDAIAELNAAAEAANEIVDTTAATEAVESANTASTNATDAAVASEATTDSEISDMVDNVSDLTDAANLAADTANTAAQNVRNAVELASSSPTIENLNNAQNLQEEALEAANNSLNAADALENAISELNAAATAANETVESEVLEAANAAVENVDTSADNANQSANINLQVSSVNDNDDSDNNINENVEDGTYTGVTLNAVDVDGEAVTYSIADGVPFNVNSDGQVVVAGDIDFETTPSYTFDVTATSADGTSSTQEITITIDDINEAPTILDTQTISTTEDSLDGFSGYGDTWSGNVYSIITQEEMLNHLNILDSDSSSFSVSLANTDNGSSYHHGLQSTDSTFSNPTANAYDEQVIQITQEFLNTYPQIDAQVGDFYFDNVAFDSLSEGESANISFGVVVSDGELSSEVKTINIEVQGSNDAPEITIASTATVDEDGSINIVYTATDVEGDVTVTAAANNGEVTVNDDGTLTFTPNENYNGSDTITVSATDSNGTVTTEEVAVTVNAVNDGPIAGDDTNGGQLVDVSANHASISAGTEDVGFTDAFTISQTITSTGNGGIIFNKENSYEIAQYGDGSIKYALRAENGSGWVWNDTGYDLPFNEEHTVAFSFDGESNTVSLYIDGGEVFSGSRNVPDSLRQYDNNELLFGERGSNNQSFEGTFDDIQVYNSALSADEIQSIADGGVISGDNLVVHYDFDGINPLQDTSGNNHDATLNFGASLVEASETTFNASEDTALTIDSSELLANDTDADGDTLSISAVEATADTHGTVSLDADGNIVFTPEADYNGEASFSYTVSDGHGGEDSATVTVNVDSVNDAVSVVSDSDTTGNTIDENVTDGTYTGVTLSATDVDGEAVRYSVEGGVPFRVEEDGRVVVDGDNTIDFEANENFTFDVTATSADGTTSTQSVTVDVNDVSENIAPEANDYTGSTYVSVNEAGVDGALIVDSRGDNPELLGGATSVDVSLSISSDTGSNSLFSYASNEHNNDFLIFTNDAGTSIGVYIDGAPHYVSVGSIYDGEVHDISVGWDSATGTTTVSVDGEQQGPSFTLGQGHVLGENGVLMLGQEQDSVGGRLDAGQIFSGEYHDVSVSTNGSEIAHWDMSNIADGEVVDSVGNFNLGIVGDVVSEGHGITVEEDSTVTINSSELLANDTDVDGDTLSILAVEATADTHGTVSLDADGNVMFTPEENYNGEVSFSYTVSDGNGATDTATVTLNVDSVNDEITQVTDTDITSNAVSENAADGTYTGITLNAVDVDGEAVTYSIADDVPFRVEADGRVVVDGDIDFETTPSYTFDTIATSADGTTSTQSVTVDINDVFEASPSDETIINGVLDDSGSVDSYTFHHNGGPLTLDALTESGMSSGGHRYRGGRGGTSTEVYNDLDGSGSQEALDIILELKDINGHTIAFNDDGSSAGYSDGSVNGLDSYINMSDLPVGDYTVDVSSYASSSSGPYQISITGAIDNAKLEINGTSADDILNGTDTDETIDGVVGADTIDARGGDDDIVFDSADTVDGGEGFDTLVLSENDVNIDLSGLSNQVDNLEAINLGDGAQNITSLTTADVLDMTDTDNLLRIDGDSSDSIDLNTEGSDAEWTLGDFKTDAETGATYQEVTGVEDDVTVTLEISTDIHIDQN